MDKIDKYLDVLCVKEDLELINEFDFSKLASKLTPEVKIKTVNKQLKNAINPNKPVESIKKAKSVMKFMPKINLSSVDKFLASKMKNFKQLKGMSNAVLKNSLPGASKAAVDAASTFMVITSMVSKKNEKDIKAEVLIKRNIKIFVVQARKFTDDYEDDYAAEEEKDKGRPIIAKEDIPDLAVAITLIIMATTLVGSLASGVWSITAAVVAFFSFANMAGLLMVGILTLAVVMVILTVPQGIK